MAERPYALCKLCGHVYNHPIYSGKVLSNLKIIKCKNKKIEHEYVIRLQDIEDDGFKTDGE